MTAKKEVKRSSKVIEEEASGRTLEIIASETAETLMIIACSIVGTGGIIDSRTEIIGADLIITMMASTTEEAIGDGAPTTIVEEEISEAGVAGMIEMMVSTTEEEVSEACVNLGKTEDVVSANGGTDDHILDLTRDQGPGPTPAHIPAPTADHDPVTIAP